ncbi:MAG: GNAT family N-acetyltransferase [Acidobacteria bacterium]|nr:GNAT family N-acetyltransferase [Acidobacteriota bacterium]
MAQRFGQSADDLDALLGEADDLLSTDQDVDFSSALAEADAMLEASAAPALSTPTERRPPPAVAPVAPPARLPQVGRQNGAPAPRAPQNLTVNVAGRPTLPAGASGTDLEVIASSPASRSLTPPDPWRRPAPLPAPAAAPTLTERLVDLPGRLAGAVPQAVKGFMSGAVGTASNVAGTMAAGAFAKTPEEARRLTAPAAYAREHLSPDATLQTDVLDDPAIMLDPQWWGYMGGQLGGSVASLAAMGAGGRVLGARAAATPLIARMPAVAAKLAQYGGPAAATMGEAFVEASDTFTSMVQDGRDPAEAAQAAERIFAGNVALLGLTNHPLFEGGGAPFRRMLTQAASEASQEGGQQVMSNTVEGKPLTEGLGTSVVLGGLGGPLAGALLGGGGEKAGAENAPPAQAQATGGPVSAPSVSVPTAMPDLRTRLEESVAASQAARQGSKFAASPAAQGAPNADLDVVLAEADQVLEQAGAAPETSAAAQENRAAAPGVESPELNGAEPPVVAESPVERPPDASPAPAPDAAATPPPAAVTPAAPVVDTAPPAVQTAADVAGEPGSGEGADAAGRPARRRVEDRRQAGRLSQRDRAAHVEDVFGAILDDAREHDPEVDPAELRRAFDERLAAFDDLQSATREEGADPRTLLQEIARKGGIYEAEGGQTGELRKLREGQAFGNIGGIPGVLATKPRQLATVGKKVDGKVEVRREARGGIGLDVMLQDLQADGRFPWLQDVNDLVDFLDDIQRNGLPDYDTLPGTERLRGELGMRLGEQWWKQSLFGEQADEHAGFYDDATAPAGADDDVSFDPAEFDAAVAEADGVLEQGAADILDTGETQPRLPGDVGAVRDEERPTPREDLPPQSLTLTAEEVPRTQGTLEQAAREADAVLEEHGQAPPRKRQRIFGGDNATQRGAQELSAKLRQKYPALTDLRMAVSGDDTLYLESIIVSPEQQGGGIGTATMRDILEWADARGLVVSLTPARKGDKGGTTSTDRLRQFYRRFGFVENRGATVDHTIDAKMYRPAADAKTAPARNPNLRERLDGMRGRKGPDAAAEGIEPMTAYHGTPHTFERFSTDKIGSGEGVQAFGHGLYFSGDKAVADWYRESLSGGQRVVAFRGQPLAPIEPQAIRDTVDQWFVAGVEEIARDMEQGSSFALAKKAALGMFDWRLERRKGGSRGSGAVDVLTEARQRIADVQDGDITVKKAGRVYQVDIPDHGDYLDWDTPLHEQSPHVRGALRQVPTESSYGKNYDPTTGKQFYQDVVRKTGSPRAASEALAAAGIPGIRYLDGSSRSRGSGTYNYVVFDDSRVTVEEVHAMPSKREPVQAARASKPPAPAKKTNQGLTSWQPGPGNTPAKQVPKNARPSDIVRDMSKLFETPVGVGRLITSSALGYFAPRLNEIRTKVANALPVLMHEFGHASKRHFALSLTDPRWSGELMRLGANTSLPSYTKAQVLEEGRAEFWRLWVLEPGRAQQEAPQWFKATEARLDAMGDLGKGLRDLQKRAQAFLAADPAARVELRIDFDGKGTTPVGDWIERATKHWVDDIGRIKDAEDAMRGGSPLPPAESAYTLARNARGSAARASDFLETGVRDSSGQFIGPSLRAALQPVAKHLGDFAVYLVALRARELHQRRIETGMTPAEFDGTIHALETGPNGAAFKKARDGVYQFQTAMLDFARHNGLISAPQQRAIQRVNQFYVPFQRVRDDGGGGPGTARRIADRIAPIKKIKGSGRDIINPLESIVKNAFAMVDAVEKNRAMQALAGLADTADDTKQRGTGPGAWLRRIKDPQTVTGARLRDVLIDASKKAGAVWMNGQMQPDIAPELEQVLTDLQIDPDEVVPIFQTTFTTPKGEQIVTVTRNGERQFYQVVDPMLYDALTQIAPIQKDRGELAEVAQTMASLLRAGATLTVGFIARNPGRDTLSAFLQSRHGFIPVYDTVRGLVKTVLHDLGMRHDEDVAQFWAQGVTQATLSGMDRKTLRAKVKQLADPAAHRRSVVWQPLELLQAISGYSEVATRVGEFSLALRQGGTQHNIWQRLVDRQQQPVDEHALAAATLAARDVTTDFSRAGTVARDFNRYAAFFNARIQGYVRIAETIKHQPGTVATNLGMLAAVAVFLRLLADDDDDYQQLAEWEKLTYWHWRPTFPDGSQADTFIRIPKPFEWAFVPNAVEAAVDYARGRDPQAFDLLKAQAKDNARTFLTGFLPTAVVPMLEATTNYSLFRQGPIVSPWDADLPLEQQAGDWTSQTARALTRAGLPLAPAKIDHLLTGHFAGLGRAFVASVSDPALRLAGIAPAAKTQPAPRWEDVPGIGALVRSAAPRSDADSIREFYDAFREMQGTERGYRRAKEDPGQQTRILDTVKGQRWRGRETDMKAAKRRIDDLADQIDTVYADAAMTPQQKTSNLERLRRALVHEARVGLGYESGPARRSAGR